MENDESSASNKLFSDISDSGLFLEGSPHFRLQNQLSHFCAALIGMQLLLHLHISIIPAAIFAISTCIYWEFLRVVKRSMSQVLKSLVDMAFYSLGICFVLCEVFLSALVVAILTVFLLYIWAILPELLSKYHRFYSQRNDLSNHTSAKPPHKS